LDKESKKWKKFEDSLEGILYELNLIGDAYADNEDCGILIAKTLMKIPKDVRDKTLIEVTFIVDENLGLASNLHIMNPKRKDKIEHPFILINQIAMREESKSFRMDVIAHEIAHFFLEHHKTLPKNLNEYLKREKEADDLIVEWGFNRTNEEVYKKKV